MNLCETAIYHLRKLASMRSDMERMKHHLEFAQKHVRLIPLKVCEIDHLGD